MNNWIDVVLRGMFVVTCLAVAVFAIPFIIIFALLLHSIFTG